MAIHSRASFLAGAACGFLTVALGAFGAHALRPYLSERFYAVWQTGVEYLGVHGVVLLVIALLPANAWSRAAGGLIAAGVALFSGSLLLMAGLNVPALGMVTPLGGVTLLAGWAAVAGYGLGVRGSGSRLE